MKEKFRVTDLRFSRKQVWIKEFFIQCNFQVKWEQTELREYGSQEPFLWNLLENDLQTTK